MCLHVKYLWSICEHYIKDSADLQNLLGLFPSYVVDPLERLIKMLKSIKIFNRNVSSSPCPDGHSLPPAQELVRWCLSPPSQRDDSVSWSAQQHQLWSHRRDKSLTCSVSTNRISLQSEEKFTALPSQVAQWTIPACLSFPWLAVRPGKSFSFRRSHERREDVTSIPIKLAEEAENIIPQSWWREW